MPSRDKAASKCGASLLQRACNCRLVRLPPTIVGITRSSKQYALAASNRAPRACPLRPGNGSIS